MTRRISPSTGFDYDARTIALLTRLGSDVTEQDFADLAVACADISGLGIDEQIQLTMALNARGVRHTLKLVTDADVHHRYFEAFDAVASVGADLVLDERYHPGASAAVRAWAAARSKVVGHRDVDGWAGVLTVSTGVPGTSNARSIEVYLR